MQKSYWHYSGQSSALWSIQLDTGDTLVAVKNGGDKSTMDPSRSKMCSGQIGKGTTFWINFFHISLFCSNISYLYASRWLCKLKFILIKYKKKILNFPKIAVCLWIMITLIQIRKIHYLQTILVNLIKQII